MQDITTDRKQGFLHHMADLDAVLRAQSGLFVIEEEVETKPENLLNLNNPIDVCQNLERIRETTGEYERIGKNTKKDAITGLINHSSTKDKKSEIGRKRSGNKKIDTAESKKCTVRLTDIVNDNSEVKRCREGKTALLVPLIEKFQLETDFVKLLLPRKISAKNAVAIHSLYIKPMYRSVINEFYLLNLHGVNSQGHISAEDFMRLLHELKTCHAHYLVHILPVCICLRCTEYRHERLNQLSECTYATPYHGPITNSPFRNLPIGQQQLTDGRPG
ncbi:unnamed protein product [Mytilus edulis]|uniref:EF-hand domain-containing protein n=1 Tax=Mytilus edulis TaxID=6550 RepID=A0A8S3UE26_MYTED|nr:unnamed protein product [Mytilus edulis]